MNKSAFHVLISRVGIAGPTTAFWPTQAGYRVTVVEHGPELRADGQGVHVRDVAITIMKRMDIEAAI